MQKLQDMRVSLADGSLPAIIDELGELETDTTLVEDQELLAQKLRQVLKKLKAAYDSQMSKEGKSVIGVVNKDRQSMKENLSALANMKSQPAKKPKKGADLRSEYGPILQRARDVLGEMDEGENEVIDSLQRKDDEILDMDQRLEESQIILEKSKREEQVLYDELKLKKMELEREQSELLKDLH